MIELDTARTNLIMRLQTAAKKSPDYTVGGAEATIWLDDIDRLVTAATRDGAENLIIAFRRYCQRTYGVAPTIADFEDMLDLAARLANRPSIPNEQTIRCDIPGCNGQHEPDHFHVKGRPALDG